MQDEEIMTRKKLTLPTMQHRVKSNLFDLPTY